MRRTLYFFLAVIIAVWTTTNRGFVPDHTFAQGNATALVIEGGTLIDGNGGPAVNDVQIVIQGSRISSIGRKGQQNRPANAQVIQADGKFILPGLWDSLINYNWYQGEAFLNNGVTSFVGIGDMGEVSVLYKEAIRRGDIRAPRPFDGPVHFQGAGGNLTGLESPFDSPHPLRNVDEARQMTKRVITLGASAVFFQNGGMTLDVFKAAVEEADKAGKPVGIRAGGPNIFPKEAALAGADFIPRSQGIALQITNMKREEVAGPDGARGLAPVNELDAWAYMDEAKAADLIKVLVQQKTAAVPAFTQKAPGLPKGWAKFEAQDRRLFGDPFLMAYYPNARAQVILWNYLFSPNLEPDVVSVRTKGYQNALRFHRMLVQAGGRVLTGSDGGQLAAPGLGVLHEMENLAEAGFTPMQIIQAATKWPAEALKVQDQLGTIEAGKLADLLIVNSDPLRDIANVQDIAWVVADGRVHDRKYHAWYRSPFLGEGPVTLPVVDDIGWAANLRRQAQGQPGGFGGGGNPNAPLPPGPGGARQPQPTIETFDSGRKDYADPDFAKVVVKEGSPDLNLRINGFNYFQRSQVYFDGIPVPTRVVSRTQIEATIDDTMLRRPGRFPIIVKNLGLADPANPALGDGTSNTAWLLVGYRDFNP